MNDASASVQSGTSRELLRHAVATLAYRGTRAIAEISDAAAPFRA